MSIREEYKGYNIQGDGSFGHKRITTSKGSLPKCLVGGFTTSQFAKVAIDMYLSSKDKK